MAGKNAYIYRFYDAENRIIYVGQTVQDINRRISQHFSTRSHLPKSMRPSTVRVEYAECKTRADLNLYEAYYVAVCKPTMNAYLVVPDFPTITLDDLEWTEFDNEYLKSLVSADARRIEENRKQKIYEFEQQQEERRKRHLARKGMQEEEHNG